MIASRSELSFKLFHGRGVELGVASGAFSREIMRNTAVVRLWSIDRWNDHHDAKEYKLAAEQLISHGQGRCLPLRLTFEEALPLFEDESLDFVYIDGYAHTGQQGGKTLREWWAKLKSGGVLAGHDYDPKWQRTVDSVDGFAFQKELPVNVTGKGDEYPSWWIIKPGESPPPSFIIRNNCPIPKGASVILVGNGPSVVLRGERGKFIDSFDCVIRFNWYAIRGFEAKAGSKTTHWCTFGRGSTPRDPEEQPERAIFVHGDKPKAFGVDSVKEAWGIPLSFYYEMEGRIKAVSRRELPKKLMPSSGFVVLMWLLEVHKVPQVTIAGFDHFSKQESPGHHYWLPGRDGRPKAFRPPPEHDGEAEAILLQPYLHQGLITQV